MTMKKLLFVLISALFIMQTAVAQSFSFGVTGDFNIAKTNDPGSGLLSDLGFKPAYDNGWSAGIKARAVSFCGLGVDVAVKYVNQNVSFDMEDFIACSTDEDQSGKIGYLSIPLHVRYEVQLPAIDYVAIPFAFVGPQFNYAIQDLDVFDGYQAVRDYVETPKTQWTLDLGLGVVLAKHFEISYTYGIPMTENFTIKNTLSIANEADANYKLGTHKIGLSIYF